MTARAASGGRVDALGPGEVVGAVLELLGQQRRAPEEPEEQWHDDGEVDQVDDGSVATEQPARVAHSCCVAAQLARNTW